MNADVEPLSEHATSPTLRPHLWIGTPSLEPMLEEEIKVLLHEGAHVVDAVGLGTKEDREMVILVL